VSDSVSVPVTAEVRRDTGLELCKAEVRVMASELAGDLDTPTRRHAGLYWSYLPTEQESGFGINIQADFYLSNSRRALALRPLTEAEAETASDPTGWNRRLVAVAAQLIVHDLWRRPKVYEREDFWGAGGVHPIADASTCTPSHSSRGTP